jgi:hypothetical protein
MCSGALPQATRLPTITVIHPQARSRFTMTLLLLEALGAGLLFVGIIWWTMFSGRRNGELPTETPIEGTQKAPEEGAALQAPAAEHLKKNSR